MASNVNAAPADIRALIEKCFQDLSQSVEELPRLPRHELDIAYQEHCSLERISDLERQIAGHGYEASVEAMAAGLLAGLQTSKTLSEAQRSDLREGVTRALIEEQKLFQFRLRERLVPYAPSDPLFGSTHEDQQPAQLPAPQIAPALGLTIGELVALYLRTKRGSWVPKTHALFAQQLALLVDHLGADRVASTITSAQMREFRDGLVRLKRGHHQGPPKSFLARQTSVETARISPKTAANQLANTRTFFRWAHREGHLDRDPSHGIRVEQPKTTKGERPRRPFTEGEITKLFSAPLFVGCRSARRRLHHGELKIRDAQWWLPVLAYYTGARMGELVQLHIGDVVFDAPIPFIAICEEGGAPRGTGEEKHVKTLAGIRQIPIHPHLLELGFRDFVSRRSSGKSPRRRLFPEIPFGADDQASSVYSKRFARLLDGVGLTDDRLVFHSFRHLAEDALRNAREPQYVIDRIIGHTDGRVSSQYGEGVSLETTAAAVGAMKLPVDLRLLLL